MDFDDVWVSKIYLESTGTVIREFSRKWVFNRTMPLHFIFIMLALLTHEIPADFALRLSYIVGAKVILIFLNYEVLLRKHDIGKTWRLLKK